MGTPTESKGTKFILSTDTSCDVFKHELKALDIPYIPLTFTVDKTVSPDEFDSDGEYSAFYRRIRSGALPVTSQINIFEHEEFFKKILENNKESDLLHLTLSGGLSNTYQSALVAAQSVMRLFPQRRIYVLDTLSATQAHRMILDEALVLRDNGTAADAAFDYLTELIPRVHAWIIADDLMHLKRGGRVSGPAAYIGTMLNIKPILIINTKGGLSVINKIKSMAKAQANIIERMEGTVSDIAHTVYLASADNGEACVKMTELIKERFPYLNVKSGWIGPIIGAHTGAGTLGIVYKGRVPRIV